MEAITTALIGFGFSARTFHLPFLQSLPVFRVTDVSTRQQDHLSLLGEAVVHHTNADQLLDQSDAELVIITSPNDSHFPLARQALEQGRHVVIDKPFVCSVAEGEELIELARRQQRLLSVFHNRRWDGDFLTLKALIASGRLGEIHQFESHFDRFRPEVRQRWREKSGRGTGIWFDLGPHLVDQALQLFGHPEFLTARLAALRPGAEVTDYFHVQLHYPGTEVILHSSPFCAAPNLRFQLHGSGGSYVKYGLDPQEGELIAGVTPTGAEWGKEAEAMWGQLHHAEECENLPTQPGAYSQYYRELADALRGKGENPVSAEQALRVMEVIELAEQSSREGRRVALAPR